jgi:RsiW-degrading membrane proteinase PrsW (M82 family)
MVPVFYYYEIRFTFLQIKMSKQKSLKRVIIEVLFGFMLVLILHIIIFAALFSLGSIYSQIGYLTLYAFLGVGISQILYIVPVVIFLVYRQQLEITKGVILGAVITALANAGCWLIVPSSIR